jgi:glycosyltransferase involved in cell wall biosynthesis
MPSTISQPLALRLSICITTFNRAAFIGATLESILIQATNDCEVVVLDGGSTDDTERVVSEYTRRFNKLRYVRQDVNNGFDRDCDCVVGLARGEYCWLMTDDDLLKPGAVAAVLKAFRWDLSLVIVNVEFRDFSMSKVLQRRRIEFESDRVYGLGEMDRLFVDMVDVLKYVGSVVIKRAIWIARERARYFGSMYIHVGVIFQEQLPGESLVIAKPVISYRAGNAHTWWSQVIEIAWVKWPSLLWSLTVSDAAKSKVCSAEPWRELQELLLWRAMGAYSLIEYQRLIRPRLRSTRETLIPTLVALLPGELVNAFFVFYLSITRRPYRRVWQADLLLRGMRQSRFHFRNWRVFKRAR